MPPLCRPDSRLLFPPRIITRHVRDKSMAAKYPAALCLFELKSHEKAAQMNALGTWAARNFFDCPEEADATVLAVGRQQQIRPSTSDRNIVPSKGAGRKVRSLACARAFRSQASHFNYSSRTDFFKGDNDDVACMQIYIRVYAYIEHT